MSQINEDEHTKIPRWGITAQICVSHNRLDDIRRTLCGSFFFSLHCLLFCNSFLGWPSSMDDWTSKGRVKHFTLPFLAGGWQHCCLDCVRFTETAVLTRHNFYVICWKQCCFLKKKSWLQITLHLNRSIKSKHYFPRASAGPQGSLN